MTKLDEIKKRFEQFGSTMRMGDRADMMALLDIAEDQDRMLSRASQDSEAVALGRDEVVRTVRAWIARCEDVGGLVKGDDARDGYVLAIRDLGCLLHGRIEVTDRRPRTEELLDLLWELKKLRTVWKETGSHEALDRLLDLLGEQ